MNIDTIEKTLNIFKNLSVNSQNAEAQLMQSLERQKQDTSHIIALIAEYETEKNRLNNMETKRIK